MTKRLVDQAIWNYTSVLLAQPFEVAKIVLQCRQADGGVPTGGSTAPKGSVDGREGYFEERGVGFILLWIGAY